VARVSTLRRHGKAGLEPSRFRQMAARGGKQRRLGRIGDRRDHADRQSQRQLCLARDADLGTDEPGGMGFELFGVAGLDVLGGGDRHQ
jgi:hypothetical protein